MEIGIKVTDRTLVFSLHGELDECSYGKIKQSMDDAIERYLYDRVLFDMAGLTFMDSTGIGMLIGRYKLLKRFKKPCYIANANASIEKILRMTGIYSIMPKMDAEGKEE